MPTAKIVAKNVGSLLFADTLGRVLSFLLFVLIARYLGDVGLGKYSFAFAFSGLFFIFSDLGVTTLMTREVSRDRQKAQEYLMNLVVLKLFIGSLPLIASTIAIFFLAESTDVIILVMLSSITLFLDSFSLIFKNVFSAFERMEFYSAANVIERLIAVIIGSILILKGYGLISLFIVLVISYSASLGFSMYVVSKKFAKIRFKMNPKFWQFFVKRSLPFWFTVFFMTIYYKMDVVMLTSMKDYATAGLYSAAYKIVDAFSFISFAAVAAIFPTMSHLHLNEKGKLQMLYHRSFYYLFVVGLPIGIGAVVLADKIILLIYKEPFLASVPALQILIWTEVLLFVNYLMGYLLNSIDKQRLFTYTAAAAAGGNLLLNFILIPRYSIIGASIATVLTQVISFLFLYHYCSANGYRVGLKKVIIKPLVAGIAMGIVIYIIRGLNLFIILPIAIATYALVLLSIKGIGNEEIDILKQFIQPFKKP